MARDGGRVLMWNCSSCAWSVPVKDAVHARKAFNEHKCEDHQEEGQVSITKWKLSDTGKKIFAELRKQPDYPAGSPSVQEVLEYLDSLPSRTLPQTLLRRELRRRLARP